MSITFRAEKQNIFFWAVLNILNKAFKMHTYEQLHFWLYTCNILAYINIFDEMKPYVHAMVFN